jgi:hypothetical protein
MIQALLRRKNSSEKIFSDNTCAKPDRFGTNRSGLSQVFDPVWASMSFTRHFRSHEPFSPEIAPRVESSTFVAEN